MWSHYNDPDTELGIGQYKQMGLQLCTPADIMSLRFPELRRIAQACSDLLDSTYKGNYPQSTKNVEALATSMHKGETLMFMLLRGKQIIAISSLVHRPNSMRGHLGFVELSKAAKLPGSSTANVSARHLSKYRLLWAANHLPRVDFLYGSPRVAAEGANGAPGGKQAQSVWWGGRKHGIKLPLLATNVGWNFRVGGIEPLTGFVAPTNATKWANAARQLPVFMPSETTCQILHTLFSEGTDGCVVPQFKTAPLAQYNGPTTLREARPSSADIVSKYYLSRQAGHLAERTLSEVDEELLNTISQKVIVESDIAATPGGTHVMRYLLARGWSLAGWQPSEVVYGGICPVFARLNPMLLNQLIQPVHYRQYFDEVGLVGTRQVLDDMYRTMYDNATAFNANSSSSEGRKAND